MNAFLSIVLSTTVQAQDLTVQGIDDGQFENSATVDTSVKESLLPIEASALTGIINGEEATQDDFPMTGGILIQVLTQDYEGTDTPLRAFLCSSTLIAPDVVLLAAHCLDFDEYESLEYRWTRQADLTDYDGSGLPDWPTDAVVAWDWVRNPDWDREKYVVGVGDARDLGLIFLDEPVDVEPAYLITSEEGQQIESGNEVDVVGWGRQVAPTAQNSDSSDSSKMKQQGVSIISELGDYEFQVGAVYSDVRKCHGDSGGPTFMHVDTDTDETLRLIGVTSRAYDYTDCRSKGGIDTRVDVNLDWIEAEMVSRCEDGTRAWCDEYGILSAPITLATDTVDPEPEMPRGACAYAGSDTSPGIGWTWMVGLLGLFAVRRR